MPKAKTEHYVNNSELNAAMNAFVDSVDVSYYRTFNETVYKQSEEWLSNISVEKWELIVGKDNIKKQIDEFPDLKLSDGVVVSITREEKEKHVRDILYKKWCDSEYFDRVKTQRNLIWKGKPKITNYIGSCFLKIATHLSYKPNFVNYMYREDMISDGIENCVQYIHNFDPAKSKNPFAYFTQISYYAFLRRIQREKRQLDIKTKIIEKTGYESLMTSDTDLASGYRNDYNAIKENIITKLNS